MTHRQTAKRLNNGSPGWNEVESGVLDTANNPNPEGVEYSTLSGSTGLRGFHHPGFRFRLRSSSYDGQGAAPGATVIQVLRTFSAKQNEVNK